MLLNYHVSKLACRPTVARFLTIYRREDR